MTPSSVWSSPPSSSQALCHWVRSRNLILSIFEHDLFCSVKSASFILLQGVPPTVSLDEVRESILNIDGVLSLHELHIWQLSESKLVASVHVLTSRNHDFMPIAVKIRETLHHLGIHSSTIQPEYQPSTSEQPFKVRSVLLMLLIHSKRCRWRPIPHASSSVQRMRYATHLSMHVAVRQLF